MVEGSLERVKRCKTRAKAKVENLRRCAWRARFAKDCWQNVRQVQTPATGSSSQVSDWTHLTSVSNQQQPQSGQSQNLQQPQQPPSQQSTQFRVSRITEMNSHAEEGQGCLIFDLRDSPKSSPKSATGSVRVMHFYIGDDAETFFTTCGYSCRGYIIKKPTSIIIYMYSLNSCKPSPAIRGHLEPVRVISRLSSPLFRYI